MAPKKKGNKKEDDDWEAELGEDAPGTGVEAEANPEEANPKEPAAEDEETGGGSGGLLAALRKNKNKKAKKGKQTNDFIEGEDPTQETNGAAADLDSKQPEEGNLEDDEDVFAGKNQKNAKAAAEAAKAQQAGAQAGDGDGFRVKTKKEKEKEKKEKEKQRKREQVGLYTFSFQFYIVYSRTNASFFPILGLRKKEARRRQETTHQTCSCGQRRSFSGTFSFFDACPRCPRARWKEEAPCPLGSHPKTTGSSSEAA